MVEPLSESYYFGEYTPSEYGILLDKEVSSEKKAIWESMYKYCLQIETAIDPLLSSVQKLYKFLSEENLDSTWWFEPTGILPDFVALIETLELAKQRGTRKAFIQFL